MARSKEHPLQVYQAGQPLPPELSAVLQPVFTQAKTAALGISIAVHSTASDSVRAMAKRRHDLRAALRTLQFTVKALEGGYRFDDEVAEAKTQAIGRAVQILEKESDLLIRLLTTE